MRTCYLVFAIIFSLAIVGLAGCVPQTLQKKINKRTYEPAVLYNTEIVEDKSPTNINVRFINETKLSDQSQVTRKKWFFFYLIVFYTYDYTMEIQLGNNSCVPKTIPFVENTITEIMKRSGTFRVSTDSSSANSDYNAIFSIKNVDIHCGYETNGTALGSIQSRNETAKMAIGNVLVNVKLFNKQNELIYEKDYSDSQSVGYSGSTEKIREVKYRAMQNLVENLTLSVQNIGRDVTKELNQVVRNESRK